MALIPGGFSETRDATEETQAICDQVKSKVEEKTQKTYKVFRAVQYRSQLVNGKNHLIKVDVGGNGWLHLSVYESFTFKEFQLMVVEEDHCKDDPLEPF